MPSVPPSSSLVITSSWLWLFAIAAIFFILAGLQAVSGIVTPFLLAAFLAIISAPPLSWMSRKGVPGPIAILLLFSVVGFSFFLLLLALKGAAESMAAQAPLYQTRMAGWVEELSLMMESRGVPPEMMPDSIPVPNAATLTGMARDIAGGLGQFTTSAFLILLAFMFMLLEQQNLLGKLNAAFPGRKRARVRARRFLRSVNRYLVIKTLSSIATGVIVGAGLMLIGVDFAILWAILAGLLNFIPTIGSIIAAIPAILIALLGLGVTEAVLVLVLFTAVNITIGSYIEPQFMGKTLGVSPLVVLISLLIWGWVFGPIGMLLSIPLTMVVKLALESSPQTRWMGVLMSDKAKVR
ncbi:MAG: AI-2E family transporter [Halomonadaceae bacterium]|nr:MAG: AI-2E family transporter [Halomonadaceae bacterium]